MEEEEWDYLSKAGKVKFYLSLPKADSLMSYEATADELNGHKKTVSESETVVGQQAEKITETPKTKSKKLVAAKTLRPTRGSLVRRIPRFINKFFG